MKVVNSTFTGEKATVMLEKYEDLNEVQLDVLTEIGNIGSGNASTALSAMIGKEILIRLPKVKILGFQEAIEDNGNAEMLIASVLIRLKGDIQGMILLLIEQDFAEIVLNVFFGKSNVDLLTLDENDISALSEIGNIMGSSYMSAIATLANVDIRVDAPSFTVDMLGAVMSVPVVEFGAVSDKILCIDKSIEIDGKQVKSNLMLIPTIDSLSYLFGKLGVI